MMYIFSHSCPIELAGLYFVYKPARRFIFLNINLLLSQSDHFFHMEEGRLSWGRD